MTTARGTGDYRHLSGQIAGLLLGLVQVDVHDSFYFPYGHVWMRPSMQEVF